MRQGYWNKDIASGRETDVFLGASAADTVIVSGGLSGMWAAHDISIARPGERTVILERDYLGFGPPERSGGIVYDFWHSLPRLQRTFGAAARPLSTLPGKLSIEFGR